MTIMTNIRCYSKLITIPSFEERFRYLKLDGVVGKSTFGSERYLNQILYSSPEWKRLRDHIILRDNGCDLSMNGYDIYGRIIIHHLEPITVEDVVSGNPRVFDPDNLVCVSHTTHNAIHYGDENLIIGIPAERTKNDTCPWKK